jgi:hypothetical protein
MTWQTGLPKELRSVASSAQSSAPMMGQSSEQQWDAAPVH